MEEQRIIHMVVFCLKYQKDTLEAENFLQDGLKILSTIPSVKDFKVLKQVSSKNEYDYGFSMEFENASDYEAYNSHALHRDFVENRWKKEVVRFLEIDFNRMA